MKAWNNNSWATCFTLFNNAIVLDECLEILECRVVNPLIPMGQTAGLPGDELFFFAVSVSPRRVEDWEGDSRQAKKRCRARRITTRRTQHALLSGSNSLFFFWVHHLRRGNFTIFIEETNIWTRSQGGDIFNGTKNRNPRRNATRNQSMTATIFTQATWVLKVKGAPGRFASHHEHWLQDHVTCWC